MKPKKEKREKGTVKALVPFKKKVSYGEVVAPDPKGGTTGEKMGEFEDLMKKMGEAEGKEIKEGDMVIDPVMTEYIQLQMKIRALGLTLGGIKSGTGEAFTIDVDAYGEMHIVQRKVSVHTEINAVYIFPWFETSERANAFIELCGSMLVRYVEVSKEVNVMLIATSISEVRKAK